MARADQRYYEKRYRAKTYARHNAKSRRIRLEALQHYGGRCACCGETATAFLTLDHINNDGQSHRLSIRVTGKTPSGGWSFYRKMRLRRYPPGLQVLCWNCNMAKRSGACPHKS